MGGLLLSLGAMIIILQAKKAFAPDFHELIEERAPVIVSPGGSIKIIYNEEPGHFLPPGFPTMLLVSKKMSDGNSQLVQRLAYSNLVDRESTTGQLTEEGDYMLELTLHVCASPGVADCTKYLMTQALQVRSNSVNTEDRIPIDLPKLANAGLAAGKIKEIKK